jgi:DNA-directed RNA polymerase subunit RPC12/RpoP
MSILLKIKILLKFPWLKSKIRKEIYKTLTDTTLTKYKCETHDCDHKWESSNLEYRCPKCKSNKITMKLKNKITINGHDANYVAFFPQEKR